jgi:hypothetical protein
MSPLPYKERGWGVRFSEFANRIVNFGLKAKVRFNGLKSWLALVVNLLKQV